MGRKFFLWKVTSKVKDLYGIDRFGRKMMSEYKGQVDSFSSPIVLYMAIYQKEILGPKTTLYIQLPSKGKAQ